MATATISQRHVRQFGGFSPFGNTTTLPFQLKTGATGGALDADSDAPLAVGDKVVLGTLPAGMRLDDATLIVVIGMTATVTGSLGFEYTDGVDDAGTPQDLAYFGDGLNLAAAGRLRTSSAKAPAVLAKTANLVLTVAVAANAKASHIEALIQGELTGPR